MAYCTNADVAKEFKGVTFASSGTTISDSTVDGFISEADAEIDGVLSRRYTVPITGTTALKIVKSISIKLVAQRVKDILDVQTGRSEDQQDVRSDSAKVARETLQSIIENKMTLVDAPLATSHDGVKDFVTGDGYARKFKINEDQW